MTIEEDLRTLGEALLSRAAEVISPVDRFRLLTAALTECDALVSRIADQRAACAADLHAAGGSFADIADLLSAPGRRVSRGRAQQLVERGRPVRSARVLPDSLAVRAPTIVHYKADGTRDVLCRPCGEVVLVAGFDDSPAHRQVVKDHKAGHARGRRP